MQSFLTLKAPFKPTQWLDSLRLTFATNITMAAFFFSMACAAQTLPSSPNTTTKPTEPTPQWLFVPKIFSNPSFKQAINLHSPPRKATLNEIFIPVEDHYTNSEGDGVTFFFTRLTIEYWRQMRPILAELRDQRIPHRIIFVPSRSSRNVLIDPAIWKEHGDEMRNIENQWDFTGAATRSFHLTHFPSVYIEHAGQSSTLSLSEAGVRLIHPN